ncbi:MAG TPA: DedA family protein [Conexibacter sp.]|nr:DedA family protein [Conexibacter sp.]
MNSLHLASISGQLVDFVARHGVLAVFALMALDALLPVGGELTMLYAGVLAAGVVANADVTVLGFHPHAGLESYLVMVAAGTLGSLLGSLAGWTIGNRGGHPLLERHGRWLHLPPHRVARAQRWFDRFGARAVFLGRLTPLVRSFISVPAGVFRSPLPSYIVLTALGSLIWCAAFAGLGWAVSDNWEQVHHAFRYADYAVVLALACTVGWLLLRTRRRSPATAGSGR